MSKRPKSTAKRVLNILVAHGVNLDLLGRRETAIYGNATIDAINAQLEESLPSLIELSGAPAVELSFLQSNDEGEFLNALGGYDGLLINAGAWTHTSLALADRLRGLGVPYVEVHLSNIAAREPFRHHSYLAPAASGIVYGLGTASYVAGLLGLLATLAR